MKNPRKIWVCVICARLRHSLLRQLRQSCQQMADRSREKYAPAVRCVHPPYPLESARALGRAGHSLKETKSHNAAHPIRAIPGWRRRLKCSTDHTPARSSPAPPASAVSASGKALNLGALGSGDRCDASLHQTMQKPRSAGVDARAICGRCAPVSSPRTAL